MNDVHENIWIAISALLLALVIKGYVWYIDPPTSVDLVNISIQMKNIPHGLSVSRVIPDKVEIEMRGAKSKIDKFRERDITAIADLSGIESEGEHDVPIRLSQSRFHGIKYQMIPETVHIIMGQHEKKFFTPEKLIVGEFNGNKMISKIEGLPESVEVSGSITSLNNVDKVVYDLDVARPGDSFNQRIVFRVLDVDGLEIKNLKVEPTETEIRVVLSEHTIKQMFPVILRITGIPEPGYSVDSQDVSPLYVEVSGDPGLIKAITSINTEPLNISNATSRVQRKVKLVLPDPAVTINPPDVQVSVEITRVTSQREINDVAIEIRRPVGGFKYTLEPSNIDITLQGPVDKLKDFDLTLIRQSIDVSKYTEGTYTVSLSPPGLPSGIGLVSFTPSEVELTVEEVGDDTPNTE